MPDFRLFVLADFDVFLQKSDEKFVVFRYEIFVRKNQKSKIKNQKSKIKNQKKQIVS